MSGNIIMPPLDDGAESARIVCWLKQPGDLVLPGDQLCELETDKSASEVTAPTGGILGDILQPAGSLVSPGTVLGTILAQAGESPNLAWAPAAESREADSGLPADFDHDLVVIGAGPGGYVAAIRASQAGLDVVVIEKDKAGGVCGNWGCIPSKSLLHSAETLRAARGLEALGIRLDTSGLDYALVQRKSREAAARAEKGVLGLLKKNRVGFVQGTASLLDAHRILVRQAGQERIITARNILLATGSRPRPLPGFEFDERQILSSNGLLALESLPRELLVIGAGAIGLELASVMQAFGVKVTVVEVQDRILPLEDADISRFMLTELGRLGLTCHTGTRAANPRRSPGGVTVTLTGPDGQSRDITVSHVLVATGRIPNTEGLGLERQGIGLDRGCVPVGDWYQTSVPGVYAIGDLVASPFLAHVASKEGEIVVGHLSGQGGEKRLDSRLIPSAVFTEPSVGSFGLTEAAAQAQGLVHQTYTFPYAGIGKASAMEKTRGLIKVIFDPQTQEILGVHLAGHLASELVHEALLAKKAGLRPADLAGMVHVHPTMSEGILEAMRGVAGGAVHA